LGIKSFDYLIAKGEDFIMDTLKIITDRLIITEFNVSMAEIVHENIGYVQAVPIGDEWEVGYHIASKYTVMVMQQKRKGFCAADNEAA